jgi:hypothetical protein
VRGKPKKKQEKCLPRAIAVAGTAQIALTKSAVEEFSVFDNRMGKRLKIE